MKKQVRFVIAFLIALFALPVCANAQTSDVGMLSIFDMFDWTSTENDVVSFFQQLPDSNISVTYDQNGRCISVKMTSPEKYEMYYFHVTKENGRIWGIEGFSQCADCCEHIDIYNKLSEKYSLSQRYSYQDLTLDSFISDTNQRIMVSDETTIYVVAEKEETTEYLPFVYMFFIDRFYWES